MQENTVKAEKEGFMTKVSEGDRLRILEWMLTHCFGFRNARTRANILPYMGAITDRNWREVISRLKHDGFLASTCSRGYWAIPLDTKDPAEVEAVLESYQEMRSKALDLLTGTDKHIKHWQDKKLALTQQQIMFV